MDFSYQAEWQMLADTIRRFITDRYHMDTRNRFAHDAGWSPEIWAQFRELGVIAALFGEDAGGFGGGGFEIALVFEELGRGLVVEPLLGVLMTGRALALSPVHADLLASIVSGETIAALAHDEPMIDQSETIVETTARQCSEGWCLNGFKAVVDHAEAADLLLVSARIGASDAVSLFAVPRDTIGVSMTGWPTVDGGRCADVRLQNAVVGLDAIIGEEGEGEAIVRDARAAGLLALCAEAVGIMGIMQETTLDFLRARQQFGVPIGKFQAIQHRMATMALEIEQARSSVINAAAAFSDRPVKRDRALSAAKVTIGRTGLLVAEEAIQLHGGIGMSWELPLSHQAKRLVMIDHQFGDADYHLKRFSALAADG